MRPLPRLLLLYTCLLVLSLCTSATQADSIALLDTGYQSDLLTLTAETAGMTVGWDFYPTGDILVTQLGYFDLAQDGLNVQHEIGIWDTSQQLMVSGTVGPGLVGSWAGEYRYVSVSSTLLSANQTFIIGATVPVSMSEPGFEPDFYPNNTIQLNPLNIVFDSRISRGAANKYAQGDTIDMFELNVPGDYMPTKNFTDPLGGQEITIEYYFFAPNFVFETNPEPTTLIIFVLGATAVLVCSSRRHRDSQLSCRLLGDRFYLQKGGCSNEEIQEYI